MTRQTIKAECLECGGTGLYIGFAEPKGTAVICLRCGGTGCREIEFTPFTKRKGRRGIQTVRQSRGSFIGTGVGPSGGTITYRQFEQRGMPS